MPRNSSPILTLCLLGAVSICAATAQEPSAGNPRSQSPQVKVNMLNVCTPSPQEQKEIEAALARVPREPLFGTDFEVSRGRSTLTDMPVMLEASQPGHVPGEPSVANYVRIRREFSVQALFSLVQYSFSNDGQSMVETLVLHVRDPKDLIEVSMEDTASAVADSDAMLTLNTPVNRIRLERFGESSIALARCYASASGPAPDQSAYEPLFRQASRVMADYRGLLRVKTVVPEELTKISGVAKPKPASTSKMKHSPAPER